MEARKEIENLERELEMIQGNIKRIYEFIDENKKNGYCRYSSIVLGELKHRIVSVKSTMTRVSKIPTIMFFNNQ